MGPLPSPCFACGYAGLAGDDSRVGGWRRAAGEKKMFGIFGRSQEMQNLDDALRAARVHPRTIPDAVKITTLKQLKDANGGTRPDARAMAHAADLLAYCVLGPQAYAAKHDPARVAAVEQRLNAAIGMGIGLDARLILLTLHAGLTHRELIERHNLGIG